MGLSSCKPRNGKDCQQSSKARRETAVLMTPELSLPSPTTVIESISVVLRHSVCGSFYGSPRRVIQTGRSLRKLG